jgi:hypothetical protein
VDWYRLGWGAGSPRHGGAVTMVHTVAKVVRRVDLRGLCVGVAVGTIAVYAGPTRAQPPRGAGMIGRACSQRFPGGLVTTRSTGAVKSKRHRRLVSAGDGRRIGISTGVVGGTRRDSACGRVGGEREERLAAAVARQFGEARTPSTRRERAGRAGRRRAWIARGTVQHRRAAPRSPTCGNERRGRR